MPKKDIVIASKEDILIGNPEGIVETFPNKSVLITPTSSASGDNTELYKDLMDTMLSHNGLGLAANQIGFSTRIAVIDPRRDPYNQSRPPFVIINPRILEASSTIKLEEGCLSIPGFITTMERSHTVTVEYEDTSGNTIKEEASGLLAQIFQHEIDHLDGKLMTCRKGPMTRQMALKKVQKHAKLVEMIKANSVKI